MKKYLLLLLGLTVVFTSCQKEDIDTPIDTYVAPVVTTSEETSTESLQNLDVNNDGDLSDSLKRTITRTDGSITNTSAWSVSADINPDFLGNNNGVWLTDVDFDSDGYFDFSSWVAIIGSGNNVYTNSWISDVDYSCILVRGGADLGVTPVISNHSETSLTMTYIGVNGSLLGENEPVDVVLVYESAYNSNGIPAITVGEYYYYSSAPANADPFFYLEGYYLETSVQLGVSAQEVVDALNSTPDCSTGKGGTPIGDLKAGTGKQKGVRK